MTAMSEKDRPDTSGSQKPRRPVVGSRPVSPAPRKVAGRGGVRPDPGVDTWAVVEQEAETPVETPPATPDETPGPSAAEVGPTVPAPRAEAGLLRSRRTTQVLGVLLACLLVAGIALGVLWRVWASEEDDAPAEDPVRAGEAFEVPDQPITVPLLEWRNANEAAVEAVTKILNRRWQTYDEHADQVRDLMTEDFADEYAATNEDSREAFLADKAEYNFAVVGQSVVQARPDRVTSLLFLNQYVYKGVGKERVGPEIYQVRVVVTTVREGGTWKVDDLQAQ